MATLKAFLIVALVFGVVTMGPIIVTIAGIGAAIWFVRALLLAEKEAKNGYTDTTVRADRFIGGEPFATTEDRFVGGISEERDRTE